MAQDGIMGLAEAARRLGCSRQYMSALVKAGRIPGARKILDRWLVHESALEGITLKGHKTSPGRKGNAGN